MNTVPQSSSEFLSLSLDLEDSAGPRSPQFLRDRRSKRLLRRKNSDLTRESKFLSSSSVEAIERPCRCCRKKLPVRKLDAEEGQCERCNAEQIHEAGRLILIANLPLSHALHYMNESERRAALR